MATPPPGPDHELITAALEGLRQTTGIVGAILPPFEASYTPHPLVELRRGDQTIRLGGFVKPNLRASHVAALREARATSSVPLVVFTDHVSAPLARLLREGELPFIDAAGNAFLDACGWYVVVIGNAKVKPAPKNRSLSPSVWQVAYVLLREPRSQSQTVRALAAHADVSPGAAQTAIAALEARGWVRNLGHRGQPVTDALALWHAWEHGYVDRLGPKLHLTQAVAVGSGTLQQWQQAIEPFLGPDVGLLGGELAAQSLGTDIVAATATLHVPRLDATILRALRIVPAKEGPITVRQRFGDLDHDDIEPHRADPMLIRAELLSIPDERLDETRSALARLIEQRWNQDAGP